MKKKGFAFGTSKIERFVVSVHGKITRPLPSSPRKILTWFKSRPLFAHEARWHVDRMLLVRDVTVQQQHPDRLPASSDVEERQRDVLRLAARAIHCDSEPYNLQLAARCLIKMCKR